MAALSLNSVSNSYVRTSVVQQQVAVDRANVLSSQAQLSQYQAQLDKDLTYLSALTQKNQAIQQLQGSQAQSATLNIISKNAQAAQQAAQQAQNALSQSLPSTTNSNSQALGTKVNVTA